MDPEALKEFYLAIHNLTGWYPTRDIFPTGKVNGKDRCSMRFDRKKITALCFRLCRGKLTQQLQKSCLSE